jgi:hypothetical protein
MAELVTQFGVEGETVAHITKYLGKPIKEALPDDFVDLGNIYVAMKDGVGKASDYFDVPRGTTLSEKADEAEAALKGKKQAEPAKANGTTLNDMTAEELAAEGVLIPEE